MRIEKNDIFLRPSGPSDALCVTTNGMIRRDGHAVMGRGIALEANKRFNLSRDLAANLARHGNHVFDMGLRTDAATGLYTRVITFPTKHDWRDDSSLELIARSARELVALADRLNIQHVYLTKPGCANGRLDWETQVRPVLEPILTGDRFIVCDI